MADPRTQAEVLPAPPSDKAVCRPWGPREKAAWLWKVPPATQRDMTERLAWLLVRWRVDPVLFAFEALRIVPAPYQAQILLDLADPPEEIYRFYGLDPTRAKRQVLVPSGHGMGKTRTEAVAIWWHKLTHMASLRLCTAPTADQLSGRLWGEVRKMYRRLSKYWPLLAQDWEILGGSIVHKDPKWGDWSTVARTARAEKPEGLQGAHALDDEDPFGDLAAVFEERPDRSVGGGILVIIEEASGVEDAIREVLEGALSEEGARLLACGNPTRPDGWFAADLERTDRYAVHQLDCRISDRSKTYQIPYRDFGGQRHEIRIRGFVRPGYWAEILRECDGDEDHDYFRVRVRGMTPRSAALQCIKTGWVEAAMARPPDPDSAAAAVVIGLDFGVSADKNAIAVRQGYTWHMVEEWLSPERPEQVTLEAARRAIDAVEVFGVPHRTYIVGDSNGAGRGAMEYLWEHFQTDTGKGAHHGVVIVLFNAGEGARDRKRYMRRRDEMWHREGRRHFASDRCSMRKIADTPGLKRQLTQPGYTEDTANRIQVESKAEITRRTGEPSGNAADACLQTLMIHIAAPKPPPKPKTNALPKPLAEHFARLRARQTSETFIQ